ncbi:hypothetical protein PENTCL1PPCAC_9791, partial [Pristionchus entomophagus]
EQMNRFQAAMILLNSAGIAYSLCKYPFRASISVSMMAMNVCWLVYGSSGFFDIFVLFSKGLFALGGMLDMRNDVARIATAIIEQYESIDNSEKVEKADTVEKTEFITVELKKDEEGLMGFWFNDVGQDKAIAITRVNSGSEAEQKGLKKGDEIVYVNSMSFDGFRWILLGPCSTVSVGRLS